MTSVGQELLNVPFGDMIFSMGQAIAKSQTLLDQNAINTTKYLASTTINLPDIASLKDDGSYGGADTKFALIALGFYPPFYQFTNSTIQVKMAISMATSSDFTIGGSASAGIGPFSATISASYTNKYSFSETGSSLLTTTLSPVPPPMGLQKYIDALIAGMSQALQAQIKAFEAKNAPPAKPA